MSFTLLFSFWTRWNASWDSFLSDNNVASRHWFNPHSGWLMMGLSLLSCNPICSAWHTVPAHTQTPAWGPHSEIPPGLWPGCYCNCGSVCQMRPRDQKERFPARHPAGASQPARPGDPELHYSANNLMTSITPASAEMFQFVLCENRGTLMKRWLMAHGEELVVMSSVMLQVYI